MIKEKLLGILSERLFFGLVVFFTIVLISSLIYGNYVGFPSLETEAIFILGSIVLGVISASITLYLKGNRNIKK